MSDKSNAHHRRTVVLVLGMIGVSALLAVVALKTLPGMLAPKVVSNRRPAAELVLPPKTPAREVLVLPQATPLAPPQAAASAAPASTTIALPDSSLLAKAVDGEEYIAELGKVAGLTEQEQAKMQPFLETIARSQELVDRVSDPDRRADMTRRLQYQAVYGMKLRVAPEKREEVGEALQKGVPRLVFPNAKKPDAVTQTVTSSRN